VADEARTTRDSISLRRQGRGRVIVISGPAGAGKNTVAERLCRELPLRRVITATTRSARPGEVDGRDYRFLSPEAFRRGIERNEFLEHATVHGQLYGTPRAAVEAALKGGEDCLLLIDVQGAMQVRPLVPDALLIFLDAPDTAALSQRLAGRSTETEADRQRRLETAAVERTYQGRYDHRVVNDDLARTVAEIRRIIRGGLGSPTGGID
jgi:guanylate kinase